MKKPRLQQRGERRIAAALRIALAAALLAELLALRPAALTERYARVAPGMDGAELLCAVCESRSFFLPGRAPDTERAARIVLDEFRAGRLGRITLETPEGEAHAEAE